MPAVAYACCSLCLLLLSQVVVDSKQFLPCIFNLKLYTILGSLVLSLELEPLIYWPTVEETLSYTHPHFAGNFHKCEGIGDGTEQYIEHSKNTDAQHQTYSTYKSHNVHFKEIDILHQVWFNILHITNICRLLQ